MCHHGTPINQGVGLGENSTDGRERPASLIGWPNCVAGGKVWEAGLRVGTTGRHQRRIIVTGTKTHEAWANPRIPARYRGDAVLAGSGLSRVGGTVESRWRLCAARPSDAHIEVGGRAPLRHNACLTLGTRAGEQRPRSQPPTPHLNNFLQF